MDAAGIIAGWKQRLIAIADVQIQAGRDNPQHVVDDEYRRLTTFAGYAEAELVTAETRLGVQFPAVFRQYLLEMVAVPGALFRGSHIARPGEFEGYRASALSLLAETAPALTLQPDAVVFLFHQGHSFAFLHATGGFDSPTRWWTEGNSEPNPARASFADMVDGQLKFSEEYARRCLGPGASL